MKGIFVSPLKTVLPHNTSSVRTGCQVNGIDHIWSDTGPVSMLPEELNEVTGITSAWFNWSSGEHESLPDLAQIHLWQPYCVEHGGSPKSAGMINVRTKLVLNHDRPSALAISRWQPSESSSKERKQRQTAGTTTSKTVSFDHNKQMQQKLTWESSENADTLYCFSTCFRPRPIVRTHSARDGSTLIRRANIYHITAALWPGITIGVCHSGRGVLRQPSLSTHSTHVTPVVPSVLSKLQWAGDSSTCDFWRKQTRSENDSLAPGHFAEMMFHIPQNHSKFMSLDISLVCRKLPGLRPASCSSVAFRWAASCRWPRSQTSWINLPIKDGRWDGEQPDSSWQEVQSRRGWERHERGRDTRSI